MAVTPVYVINPAMGRWQEEAKEAGRIILAFGELEFAMCNLAAEAVGLREQVLRSVYRIRITSGRLQSADALMSAEFAKDRLGEEYASVFKMVMHCLAIRNQYAHCNWGDHHEGGLFFTSIDDAAVGNDGFSYSWRHVDLELLQRQHSYFALAMSGCGILSTR